MTSRSDADVFGFRRSDIYDFLESCGLKLSRPVDAQSAQESAAVPRQEADSSASAHPDSARANFSAITAAKRAQFISYREAMQKLREFTGDKLQEIAVGLKSHGIHEKCLAYLAGPEQAVRRVTGSEDVAALLDETIENGGIIPAWVGPDDQADPDRCGWFRGDLITTLRLSDLPCPDSLGNTDAPFAPELPDWVGPYIGRHEISLGHAAAILAEIRPSPQYSYNNLELNQIAPWRAALKDAYKNGEINSSTTRYRVDREDGELALSHAGIRAWCARRGHKWPIPELNTQPAIDGGPIPASDRMPVADVALAERLRAAEAEIDRLRNIEAESVELRRRLDTAIASLADANARLAELDASDSGPADVRSLRDEIVRLKEFVPPRPEFLIPIVVAVQKQFWAGWDESKPRPKAAEEIQPWISANFPQIADSNALVQAVEKVACPFNRNPSAKRLP